MATQAELVRALHDAWAPSTSANPTGWSRDVPSYGQCAVSALVLQDHLGGTLMRSVINGESHYWLRTPSGVDLDITVDQFPPDARHTNVEERTREYVLAYPDTRARYDQLRSRVNRLLSLAIH